MTVQCLRANEADMAVCGVDHLVLMLIVMLKVKSQLISDAERDGDRIHCVIRDVLSGYDGNEDKLNFFIPSAAGQERRFFNRSNLDPPLLLGSIKSNLGHTEGAAGVASLIKVAMCIYHRSITANMQFTSLNPKTDAQKYNLHILQNFLPFSTLPNNEKVAIGINSFGMVGTTTHSIIEEYQPINKTSVAFLQRISQQLLLKRTISYQHSAIFIFLSHQQLQEQINAFLTEQPSPGLSIISRPTKSLAQKICFVFSGQGPQWCGGDQTAAFVADRLSLEEAVRMLTVSMGEEEIENKLLKGIKNLACIAVVNSPRSVTRSSDEMQQILSISNPNVFKACVRIENAFHSYQMNRFDIEKDIQTVRFYDALTSIIKDKTANVFLEISLHLVLATSIRECYELTNQQQSSPPLILPTLKRKENEQITLLTSLAQLTTSSHVWQQYFHTRQLLPMKNHEEYFDNFPLYKFHLSSCWYESKDSSIQRLANRMPAHPLLGIRQLNEQTNHKIQDAILFPVVVYLELATAACHQLLSSKEDDQQQLTLIFEDINFIKALILNEHELVEVCIQIIMPMREWFIILCNQDNLNKYSLNKFTLHAQVFQKTIKTLRGTSTTIICQLLNDNNNCSSYYLLHPYLVLLPDVETTFLPVRIQNCIYSSKTKAKMNQSTNIEVCGNYYDNICEPIFTSEGAVIQQVQGVHSDRCNQDLTELAAYYAQMVIKDLDLNQQHHPLLNACRSLASTTNKEVTWHSTHLRLIQLIERFPHILSGEKTGSDIFLGDDETGETFQQIKTLISATKTQHIFHTICQHLQLQYERQTKDDNSFENYRLRIFWLSDSHCSDVLPILDLLLNLSQQTGLLIDVHYADSDPTQLANAQQTFNTHINNQTKNLSIIYDETIDLYDS
ncbi:unnamed protein product, partial [Adineta steineri]